MIELVEEHVSPDGHLRFQVTRVIATVQVILGFEGFSR